jgi:pilus assembly protein Flp/PilA
MPPPGENRSAPFAYKLSFRTSSIFTAGHYKKQSTEAHLRQFIGQREELCMSRLMSFCRNEAGATAIEYGLIAAGISIAIIVAVTGLGSSLNTTFTSVQTSLK